MSVVSDAEGYCCTGGVAKGSCAGFVVGLKDGDEMHMYSVCV